VRPGWSSADGGIEEFPELREISRFRRATRRASPAVFRLKLRDPAVPLRQQAQ
jgi:hypothetical protein